MHNFTKNVEKDINIKIVNNLILSALRLFVFVFVLTGSTDSAVPIKYFKMVIDILNHLLNLLFVCLYNVC
jgi:hypothetical protein